MERNGVAGLLMEAFPGRIEPHAPWAFLPRECSMLLRGDVPLEEAQEVIAEAGYEWLNLIDNGIIPRAYGTLEVSRVHAYHLLPVGVSKAAAAAADARRRGLHREETIAVGDSPSDARLAEAVGAVFIVANGREAVEAAGGVGETLYATGASHGDGFAEAVSAVLS
jgi:hydroxymethylpyrimidine pyrophosphatase-like HAD family hydrolase